MSLKKKKYFLYDSCFSSAVYKAALIKIFLLFQEQMDGKDNLLWQRSALARPPHVKVMRRMFPLLQPSVLNNCAMESSINGCTVGGCVRKTIKLKVKHFDSHVN